MVINFVTVVSISLGGFNYLIIKKCSQTYLRPFPGVKMLRPDIGRAWGITIPSRPGAILLELRIVTLWLLRILERRPWRTLSIKGRIMYWLAGWRELPRSGVTRIIACRIGRRWSRSRHCRGTSRCCNSLRSFLFARFLQLLCFFRGLKIFNYTFHD